MNYRSVDVILENGMKLYEKINIDEYAEKMTLNGVVVDQTKYDLKIEKFQKTTCLNVSYLFQFLTKA